MIKIKKIGKTNQKYKTTYTFISEDNIGTTLPYFGVPEVSTMVQYAA